MYGIICIKFKPNVGKCSIHGASGMVFDVLGMWPPLSYPLLTAFFYGFSFFQELLRGKGSDPTLRLHPYELGELITKTNDPGCAWPRCFYNKLKRHISWWFTMSRNPLDEVIHHRNVPFIKCSSYFMMIYHSDFTIKKTTEQIQDDQLYHWKRWHLFHLHNVTWSPESSRSLMLPQGAWTIFFGGTDDVWPTWKKLDLNMYIVMMILKLASPNISGT